MPVFDRNGRGIAYSDEGSGPPVVLLHGLLMDRSMWDEQVAALSPTYRVVTIDAPGHGESDPAPAGWDFRDAAADVWATLDAAGVTRPVIGGQSMGGWTALRCATERPGAVRGLMLMDTSAGPEDPEKIPQYEAFLQIALTDGINEDLANILLLLLFCDTFVASPAADPWRKKFLASDPRRFETPSRAVFARPDISGLLAGIDVPAVVVHGLEDISIPVERADQLGAALGAPVHRIEGAGHAAPHEIPAAVTPILKEFLDNLPG